MPQRQQQLPQQLIYPPSQAAPLIHPDLSPRTLERWRAQRKGPRYVRIGKRVGYTMAAIHEYHTEQTEQRKVDA